MSATLTYMPKEKKEPSTTIRIPERLWKELDVIAEYLGSVNNKPVSIASVLEEWCRPHISKIKHKAIEHRIEKTKQIRELG